MRLARTAYIVALLSFLYVPIFIVMAYSFNNASYSLMWHGFTWKWYQTLMQDQDLWLSFGHSLILGASASIIATGMGTLMAICLSRFKFPGKQVLHGLIFILILFPDIVLGIALLTLFNSGHIPLGFWTLLMAHITFCLPFVVVTVYGRLSNLDARIFDAALDLGASEWQLMKTVILPLIMSALFASLLLSFTLSLDDVIVSYFVAGPDYEILPLKILGMLRAGVKPEVNALCSIVFAITVFLVILAQRFGATRR